MTEADVVIIGGGIGGMMTARRIKKLNPNKKVLIIEKGRTIENRSVPHKMASHAPIVMFVV